MRHRAFFEDFKNCLRTTFFVSRYDLNLLFTCEWTQKVFQFSMYYFFFIYYILEFFLYFSVCHFYHHLTAWSWLYFNTLLIIRGWWLIIWVLNEQLAKFTRNIRNLWFKWWLRTYAWFSFWDFLCLIKCTIYMCSQKTIFRVKGQWFLGFLQCCLRYQSNIIVIKF